MSAFSHLDILFLEGEQWGNGHKIRMQLFSQKVKKISPIVNIRFYSYEQCHKLSGSQVLLCDIRDFLPEKKVLDKYQMVVFLDYRGSPKAKQYFYVDTLPHFDMTIFEYKNALRFFLTDVPLEKKKRFTTIAFQRQKNILNKQNISQKQFLQLPLHWQKKRLPRQKFLQELKRKEKFVGYFGQSLLEALLLKKEVEVFAISHYHANLSKSFMQRWNASSMNALYLDGQGSKRLFALLQKYWQKT